MGLVFMILSIYMAKVYAFKRTSTLALRKRKAALVRQLRIPSNLLRASFVERYARCGKTNCRCAQGRKHGPFYYLTRCLGVGLIQKVLLKTEQQQQDARQGIQAYERLQTLLEELYQINSELLRRAEPLYDPQR